MKDPQKQKVYQAEWAHSAYDRPDFRSIEAVKHWTHQLIGSTWFGRAFPHMAHSTIDFFNSDNQCSAWAVSNAIEMPRWSWRKIVICHELAHLCNADSEMFQKARQDEGLGRRKKRGAASHGKKFCTIFLKIVRHALGKEAEQELRRNFRLLGVQYESKNTRRRSRQRKRSNVRFLNTTAQKIRA